MLRGLSESEPDKDWKDISLAEFKSKFHVVDMLAESFIKKEIQICLRCNSAKLKERKIYHRLSWPKYKITQLLYNLQTGIGIFENPTQQRG